MPCAFKHLDAQAADSEVLQVAGKPGQQSRAILRPIFSILLELNDVSADEPVADDEGLIDGGGGMPEQLLARRINGFDKLKVFHGRTRVAASPSAGAIECIALPRIVFQTFPVAILETVNTKDRTPG